MKFIRVYSYLFALAGLLILIMALGFISISKNIRVKLIMAQSTPELIIDYDGTTCPSGYSEYTSARGRYIVGLNPGGTLAGTDGSALGNLEDRPTGQHTHTINDPGHYHTIAHSSSDCADCGTSGMSGDQSTSPIVYSYTSNNTTGISINAAGSVPGTNAPYIQLMAIKNIAPPDTTPPNNVAITNFGSQCYQPSGSNVIPSSVMGVASDNIAVTSAWYSIQRNPAAGGFCLDNTNNAFDTSCNSTLSYIQKLTFDGTPINYNGTLSPAVFASPAPSPNDTYAIQLFARDAAGNIGSSTPINFLVDNACITPFLQTNQGDVHSNIQINTPGGP